MFTLTDKAVGNWPNVLIYSPLLNMAWPGPTESSGNTSLTTPESYVMLRMTFGQRFALACLPSKYFVVSLENRARSGFYDCYEYV